MLRLKPLKKADGFEQKLTGYRTLVLASDDTGSVNSKSEA
jgi:hypothetical protein